MHHKRILVAVSSTEGRDAAFERSLALAKASGSELYLLHAVSPRRSFSFRAAVRLQRASELRTRAEAAGVSAQAFEQHGDPAEIIVLHADARPIDLIVMGTERRTGWARLRQRSVAERVLRRTKRPTLVVGADDAGDEPGFRNVLVGVDLSPGSASLIDAALRFAAGDPQRLTVVHAADGVEAEGDVRRQIADLIRASLGPDVTVPAHVGRGRAAEIIRTQASAIDAGLIVMGRSRRWLHLGSTAVRLLRTSDRALLIVPTLTSSQTRDGEQPTSTRAA